MKKRSWVLWISLCTLWSFLFNLPILANEEKGTIEICLEESNRSYQGVTFEAYRCATSDGESLEFLDLYKDCTLQIGDLNDSAKMRQALQYFEKQKEKESPYATSVVNEQGKATFENLPYGLYFFCVSEPGEYELVGSFVAVLPTWNTQDGRFESFLRIQAKAYPLPDLCILKVDSDKNPILNKEFSFSAYEDEKSQTPFETKSGDIETGMVEFRLRLGQTIYIQESKAPEGYVLSQQRIKVSMDLEGNLYINEKKGPVDQLKVKVQCINRTENEEQESPTPDFQTPGQEGGEKPGTNPGTSSSKISTTPTPTAQKPSTATSFQFQKWLLLGILSSLIGLVLKIELKRKKNN